MRARWSNVLLGALVGGLCALAVGQWNMRRMRREQEEFQQSLRESVDKRRTDDLARIAIAAQGLTATGPAPAASRPSAPAPEAPVVAANIPSREAMWQGAQVHVQKHRSDPVDAVWAARVTPALESDLKRVLADTKVSLGSVSCRSTSCLGALDWPTLAEARRDVKKMLFAPMGVDCARTAVIPPDATDERAPVRMDVLFDCASWKAKGSEIPAPPPQETRSVR